MQLSDVLLIGGAVFIFFVCLIIFYAYLMRLKIIVDNRWLELIAILRVQQDMIPLMIEIARYYIKDAKLINEIIKARRLAYFNPTDENIAEMDFMIKRILNLEKRLRRLRYDLDFLGIKNDFAENFEEVQRRTVDYNIAVNKYNKIAGAFGRKISLFEI
ncbi:hypothetical protein HZA39_04120 [Candidatus Peregrinibacteria bacterium]|nr:hypothetical protein [Candidatus Peregrinibacteria bacterium]